MRVDQAVNIEDLHKMAKRRLPKVAFDFIEGGLEDEHGLDRNTSAFRKHQLLPRYLVDVSVRDQSQTIFGQKFSSPFGISPTGGTSLFRNHTDLMLAEAARDANIPYIMSGGSSETIEACARIAPKNHWYQLYAARNPEINADMIRRVADAGLGALVLTVDTPVGGKRERKTSTRVYKRVRRPGFVDVNCVRAHQHLVDLFRCQQIDGNDIGTNTDAEIGITKLSANCGGVFVRVRTLRPTLCNEQ
jgi:isopentenyl diphosphate isomerase/L-lactate dehydrogenase-like FMN-dependent dehydrogenase